MSIPCTISPRIEFGFSDGARKGEHVCEVCGRNALYTRIETVRIALREAVGLGSPTLQWRRREVYRCASHR